MFSKRPGLVGIKGLSASKNPIALSFAPRKVGVMTKIAEKSNESEDADDVIAVKGNVSEEDEAMGRYVNLEVHFRNSFKMMTCGRRWSNEDIIKNVSKQLNVT